MRNIVITYKMIYFSLCIFTVLNIVLIKIIALLFTEIKFKLSKIYFKKVL